MLSKLIIASLGIGAAILLAPTATAEVSDLTNHDVAATQDTPPVFVPYKVNVPVAASGGGGQALWANNVFDEFGNHYTDERGRVLQRCISNACGDDRGQVRVAPTECGNTAPVNVRPKPDDDGSTQPASE